MSVGGIILLAPLPEYLERGIHNASSRVTPKGLDVGTTSVRLSEHTRVMTSNKRDPNKRDLKQVRQLLESQLAEGSRKRGQRESIHIHQVADALEMIQQAVDRELAIHGLDQESMLVRRLRSAIERVDDGSYGTCLHCEEEIAPKRLNAIPWAELCIQCQESADHLSERSDSFAFTRDQAKAA